MGAAIRVKESAADIKCLNQAENAARHIKSTWVRTKAAAEKLQDQQSDSDPAGYAQKQIAGAAEHLTRTGARKTAEQIRHLQQIPVKQIRMRQRLRESMEPSAADHAPGSKSKPLLLPRRKAARRAAGGTLGTGSTDAAKPFESPAQSSGHRTAFLRAGRKRILQMRQTAAHKPAVRGKQAAYAVRTARLLGVGRRQLFFLAASGSGLVLLVLIVILLFGGMLYAVGGDNAAAASSVSPQVQAREPVIRMYAEQHGIPEYVELIKAVMMQESGGNGSDPMQASECGYNKKYPRTPGGIPDPDYSINVGIQNLAACLKAAKVTSPMDLDSIKTALQGYNYGNGYIAWAIKRDGGYTAENAAQFSMQMAKKLGWSSYGDKDYVPHVLRYYTFGRTPSGMGDTAIVQVALQQEGNVGGQPYWSWYGFSSRVEWCACFVSWCANECGYIKQGIFPKFAACMNGAAWFRQHRQWQDRSYVPKAGDIIFFNWNGDAKIDHVGIVVKVAKGKVYTIEGNSRNQCKQRDYPLGSSVITGYGVPRY